MMFKYIDCKYPIEIERKEIYPAIYEYSVLENPERTDPSSHVSLTPLAIF